MADRSEMRDCHDGFLDNGDDISLKESGNDEISDEETPEYPPTVKLVPILIGLCFQSFCIALVSWRMGQNTISSKLTVHVRITPSSRPQFPKSQSSSTPWKTYPGTRARIS